MNKNDNNYFFLTFYEENLAELENVCNFASVFNLKKMRGLITRTTGSWYKVLADNQQVVDCRLRGKFRISGIKQTNPLAVGDWVEFEIMEDGNGLITAMEERKNHLIRRATKLSKQTHVIAANIDLLCLVATLGYPRTSTGFMDRMLVTAEAYHIPAVIVMNKIDLYNDELWDIHNEIKEIYTNAGYQVYEVSALTGDGINELKNLIRGKVCLFSGHSGVGKSALLNAIDPTLDLREGEVSDWTLKGTHTTTFAEIFPFGGGYLIDSPGIKEFGMVDFEDAEVGHFFPEMRARLHDCYFANCTHRHEPRCAVKQAVEDGLISEERYHNYLNILESLNEERGR